VAKEKKNTEEDYLDSLLKSVMAPGEKINEEDLLEEDLLEEDFISDEDFLGEIEKDLFKDGIADTDFDTSEENNKLDNKKTDYIVEEIPIKVSILQDEDEDYEDILDNSLEEELSIDDHIAGLEDILSSNTAPTEKEDIKPEEIDDSEIDSLIKEKPKDKKKGFFKSKKEKKPKNKKTVKVDVKENNEVLDEVNEILEEGNSNEVNLEEINQNPLDALDAFSDLFSTDMGEEEEASYEEETGISDLNEEASPKDENNRLINEMDNGDFDEEEILDKDGKKKKKEKKKKEKKVKPPKAKKQKKEKVKREKEPDEIIKISKGFLIFSFSLIILIVVLLNLGGKSDNYKKKTDEAVKYYVNKNYEMAYNSLYGLTMNKDDQFFYDQVHTIMLVNRHFSAYSSLIKLNNYNDGLFSLLRGVKMYDKYKEKARKLNCFDDLNVVLSWIDKGLLETYNLTESEAREINLIKDRYDYSKKIYSIADEARIRIEAQKAAETETTNTEGTK